MNSLRYNKINEIKKEINKYYGIETNDVFKIDQELNAIYMNAIITVENYPCYTMNIRRDNDFIIIKKETEDTLEIKMNNKFHSKTIYRKVLEDGNIEILSVDTRDSYENNAQYITEGRILYSKDGIFKEEEITMNKISNDYFSSYTHTLMRNIDDSLIIKKIEISDVEEPSRDKVSHFFTRHKQGAGMDYRVHKGYTNISWKFISEEEFNKYLSGEIKDKIKEKKIFHL